MKATPSSPETAAGPATAEPTGTLARRDFIKRLLKAAFASLAVVGAGRALHTSRMAGPRTKRTISETMPDFSVPGLSPRISIVTGPDRVKTVNRALELLGGIGTFVQPGDRVAIKVNAAFASPPAVGATTHPELVAAVARLCYQAGAARVLVLDNPINDPATCFQLSGIGRAAESAGARVVLPRPELFRLLSLPDAKLIRNWPVLVEPLLEVNKLIGVAPVKDHHRSGASLSMKNWYGLLGGRRNVFHQEIHTIITELARLVRPTLVILDGTMSMVTNGPTGGSLEDLRATETMIVSTDQVAADVAGANLLGRPLNALTFLGRAAAAGVGTTDLEALRPLRATVR